ncbi:hypothetical protein EL22_26625 [Halostagnicola sp. A56]|uniref:UPF0146 family protein n=1 Tax=Halostagnicola sp. A56 TaxID=1495067 RepID=UPI00065F6AF6|nr:UPF0146 family protein [Halostagnicola sp. A56]KMT45877.1 hypothetical protein EL22_26625 [Halostagnicola sp. A56]
MAYSRRNTEAIRDYLSSADRVVEVGIGRRTDLASVLAKSGVSVTATDVHDRSVPDAVTFVRDDIVEPEMGVYEGADAVVAQNLPPELHRPTLAVARAVDATFVFTTLGGDQPTVPVERKTIPGGTLFVAD